jgi:hypothetical protein
MYALIDVHHHEYGVEPIRRVLEIALCGQAAGARSVAPLTPSAPRRGAAVDDPDHPCGAIRGLRRAEDLAPAAA